MDGFLIGALTGMLTAAPAARATPLSVTASESASASTPASASLPLQQVAQSTQMIWNAVARFRGETLVGGPRWASPLGADHAVLSVASTGAETQTPWPDADWNSWKPGDDPSHKFVNVNALHIAPDGDLWIVDTGTPVFGAGPLPSAAKLVRVAGDNGQIRRIYPLGPTLAHPGSYIDDIRFHGTYAFLTDAGRPGLIVLDTESGVGRRVLDNIPATTARPDRPIVMPAGPDTKEGRIVRRPNGAPLLINTDPLEVSPDGTWLYFGTLEGPWSKVRTADLENAALSPADLTARVMPWADLPPVGGTAIDAAGNLYFSNLRDDSEQVRAPDGTIKTLVASPELHWVDAPFLDDQNDLWLPVPQLDRAAPFNQGQAMIQFPVKLFRLPVADVASSQPMPEH